MRLQKQAFFFGFYVFNVEIPIIESSW